MPLRVVAVVLHHRSPGALDATLDALRRQTSPPERIVVVDNASGDGTPERLRRDGGVDVVEAGGNGGYAAGMNLGAAAALDAGAEAVLLLTHECRLEPTALDALRRRLEESPGTGAVGPLLAWSSDPDRVWSVGGHLDAKGRLRHDNEPAAVSAWRGARARRVDWVDGAAILFRAEALRNVGPIDERYFLYYEEADHLLRMGRLGWTVECVPDAVARQEPGGIPVHLWFRNRLLFAARWMPRRLPVELLSMGRSIASFTLRPPLRPALRPALLGIADAVRRRFGPPPGDLLAVRVEPDWRRGLRLKITGRHSAQDPRTIRSLLASWRHPNRDPRR